MNKKQHNGLGDFIFTPDGPDSRWLYLVIDWWPKMCYSPRVLCFCPDGTVIDTSFASFKHDGVIVR